MPPLLQLSKMAAEGEKTKYKALVKHMHDRVFAALGKDPAEGLDESTTASFAKIMETSKLSINRPDRRFPNMNQLNNCW